MKRAAPLAAWGAFALTVLVALGWGAHVPHSWDVDNIAPGSVLRAMAARFGPEWYSSYGPVPYVLVALVYAPMLLFFRLTGELGTPVAEFPWGFRHPEGSVGALILAARLLTAALAFGIAWMAAREAREEGPRSRWLVPLLLAGSPAFAYYARTTNVDLHYLFFLVLAFHLAGRGGGARMAVAAGAAAALAVCSKEQSAPVAAAAFLAVAWRGPGRSGAAPGRLKALGLAVAGAGVAYLAAWGLPFRMGGWVAHHRFVFEQARYPRDFPATLEGFAGLAARTVEQLPLALGWPILVGAGLAVLRRPAWRGLGPRVLGVVLYALGFIAVVGYVYPRFLLPVMVLGLPLAVRGWSAALEGSATRRRVLVAVLLALTAIGGPLVGLAQLRDSRYRATEWLERFRRERAEVAAPLRVEQLGNPRFQPRVPPGFMTRSIAMDTLGRVAGPTADLVVMSSFDRYLVENDPELRAAWLDTLGDARGPYRLAADLPPPRWSRAVRGLPFSPVIWIWARREPGSP